MAAGMLKRISIFVSIIFLFAKKTTSLRAQQAPCYEFLCGNEPSPLCASDGITYLNGCFYSQAQCKNPALFVTNPGTCERDQNESSESFPDVELVTEDVTVQNDSAVTTPSASNDPCTDSFCPSRYQPVCGSDGITYSNICQFTKTQCRIPGLELRHEGRCKTFENCLTRICAMKESSLCGSDGKTYRNICELSIMKCYSPSLNPVGNGPCSSDEAGIDGQKCDALCEDDQYRPVCATDNRTFPNVCYFQRAKCRNSKLKIFKFEPC